MSYSRSSNQSCAALRERQQVRQTYASGPSIHRNKESLEIWLQLYTDYNHKIREVVKLYKCKGKKSVLCLIKKRALQLYGKVEVRSPALTVIALYRGECSCFEGPETEYRLNFSKLSPSTSHLFFFSRRISHVISYHFAERSPHAFQACALFVFPQGHNSKHSHTVVINTDSHTQTSVIKPKCSLIIVC